MTDETALPQPVFTDPRRVSIELHDHLRTLILDEVLPGGSVIKQTELARAFGVSRTPTREAFRMLQEEGLIEAIYNQRARVRDLDFDETDQLFSVRIVLETLGVRITAGRLTADEHTRALEILAAMDEAYEVDDFERWVALHLSFHQVCVARADEPLLRIIRSYAERSRRYSRVARSVRPDQIDATRMSHRGILSAVVDGDADRAAQLMSGHLSRTSLAVLRALDAEAETTAVLQASAMTSDYSI